MIAHKKIDGDTCVCELGQFTEQAHIAFRHNGPVFVPKIEHISYDEDGACAVADLFEKCHDLFFTFQACSRVGRSEMEVGEKINFLIGR
ncbi:hypothetical protein D9M68_984190 [compost metagenome]